MLFFGNSNKETWSGAVTRKGVGTDVDEDGGRTTYYNVYFKLADSGKEKRVKVSPELYNSLEVGDNVVKPAGATPSQLQKA